MSTPDGATAAEAEQTTRRGPPAVAVEPRLAPGDEVAGRYWVIEFVGAGGMGRVHRAYDARLQREVALKELSRLDGRAESRLAREARAMAQLSHPHVVAVYDAVLEERGLSLVMEYVRGPTLRQWLDESARTWSSIVDVFAAAGRGLAAAHQKGLVHRDFKPANVIVGEDGRARVTDFGLAKALVAVDEASSDDSAGGSESRADPRLLASDDVTEAGTLMGTPRYMAPEQHEARDADASSDQYAWCLALWEALAGRSPFAGPDLGLAARKREGPPPWSGPAGAPRALVGILQRGLAPNVADRWPGMSALLHALERARAPRRRMTGLVLGACGLVGAIATAWAARGPAPCAEIDTGLDGAWTEDRAEALGAAVVGARMPFADRTAQVVGDRLDAFARDWAAATLDNCEATRVRAEQSDSLMDRSTLCLRRARVRFEASIEAIEAQAARGDIEDLAAVVDDLPRLSRCRDPEMLAASVQPPEDEAQAAEVERLDVEIARAAALTVAGDAEASRSRLEAIAPAVEATGYAPLVGRLHAHRGEAEQVLGRFVEAEAELRRAYTTALGSGDDATAVRASGRLGQLLGYDLSRPAEGLWVLDAALALAQRPGIDRDAALVVRLERGTVLLRIGRPEEALAELRAVNAEASESFAPGDPVALRAATALGAALFESGHNEEALELHRTVLDARRRTVGEMHPNTALAHINVAAAVDGIGRPEEAIEEIEAARRIVELVYPRPHPLHALCELDLAVFEHDRGDDEAAVEWADAALATLQTLPGSSAFVRVKAHQARGRALETLGRPREAETDLRRAITLAEEAYGPIHIGALVSRVFLARILAHDSNGLEQAEAEARRGLEGMEATLPEHSSDLALARETLAEILLSTDRPHDAVKLLLQARTSIAKAQTRAAAGPILAFKLAQALRRTGEPKRARELAKEARRDLAAAEEIYATDRETLAEIDAFLAAAD